MTNVQIQMTNESKISNQRNTKFDIQDRALEFAARAAKFVRAVPKNQITLEYGKQLIRSSASVGANLEEADGTLSKKDFINKLGIARREARESRYWIRLFLKADLLCNTTLQNEANWLHREGTEILLILSTIIQKTQERQAAS